VYRRFVYNIGSLLQLLRGFWIHLVQITRLPCDLHGYTFQLRHAPISDFRLCAGAEVAVGCLSFCYFSHFGIRLTRLNSVWSLPSHGARVRN
jgi:hypothetical protein